MRRGEKSCWWVKEKKDMALLFLTITMMLHFQVNGCVGCLETERIGLLQLKAYLNSLILLSPQEEGILKSWSDNDPKSNCCLWEGVKCSDAIGGHIVHLSARGILSHEFRLSGGASLSLNLSLLHSFPQLETLDFSWNGFYHLFDPIHGYMSFQRLEKLRTLVLFRNHLDNSILPYLSAARSLKTLSLGANRMEGVSPPNELANLTELRELYLAANQFTSFSVQGLINFRKLEVLGLGLRMTKLTYLDLSYNEFSEAARLKGLEHLVELKVLILTDNNFNHTRSIQVLEDMPKLQELDLSFNGFTDLGLVFPSSLQVLDLTGNKLSSTPKVYSKICALINLRELDLRNNALTKLPYCLSNLSGLRTLELSYNQLNGNLSPFVSGLPSGLEFLSLLDNNFNGSFLFSSLVNHTRLTVFKLSSQVGTIQAKAESSWVPLFQLKLLILQNVILGSTIPSFLIHQHDLCYLDLSHNKLTGAFPAWLVENNTRLLTLLLNGNSLTNLQLPSLIHHGLQALDISSNEIHDPIQEDIGIVFPKLRGMNFSFNHFYGMVPSSVGEMKSLETFDVSFNDLYGQLPTALLSSCYSLGILKLSNNQFQGSLGKGLLHSKNTMMFLDISENRFSGASPHWIGRMSYLDHLNMSSNQLKGPFPRHLQNLPWLKVIDISHNSFSGAIPNKIGIPHLLELRLQSNKFMGTIPDTWFNSATLEVIDLRNNNFSGKIMSTVVKRSNLRVLLLRNNSFQSHIPKNLCQLSKVSIMDLSHNKLKGVIPSCLGSMSFGRHKYQLSIGYYWQGRTFLPRCQYASHLSDLEPNVSFLHPAAPIGDVLTKNRYETYQGDILDLMCDLDLSSNQLSGEIPVEIGNLESIRSLNFSNNHLTSSIPVSFSKLKDLGSLDLSNNNLDGSIPPQLADLSGLGVFNVSFNNLSGKIPLNGHLSTFGEMSYIGNPHLSRAKKSCNPMPEPRASKPTKEEEEEGDGVIDMVWFYWTCGAVYISTLLALSAFLFIDSPWSREWFYRVDLSVHHLQRFKRRFICN